MPQVTPIVVNDVIRGQISFDPAELGDFIIRKSDGFPTYNFAVVVDDYLMQVTHVLRGQEHLMNTPSQKALWEALFPDRPVPEYAHMSVTVSDTGGKLSKRERPQTLRTAIKAIADVDIDKLAQVGDITPDEFARSSRARRYRTCLGRRHGRASGRATSRDQHRRFLPQRLSARDDGELPGDAGLEPWRPAGNHDAGRAIQSFDISRLTKSNSLFDRKKLLAFNTEHLRLTPPQKVLEHFKAYLKYIGSPVQRPTIPSGPDHQAVRRGTNFEDIER